MYELNLVRLDGRGMRTDVEAQGVAVRLNDIEGELALRFGQRLPSLADVIRLFYGRELGRKS